MLECRCRNLSPGWKITVNSHAKLKCFLWYVCMFAYFGCALFHSVPLYLHCVQAAAPQSMTWSLSSMARGVLAWLISKRPSNGLSTSPASLTSVPTIPRWSGLFLPICFVCLSKHFQLETMEIVGKVITWGTIKARLYICWTPFNEISLYKDCTKKTKLSKLSQSYPLILAESQELEWHEIFAWYAIKYCILGKLYKPRFMFQLSWIPTTGAFEHLLWPKDITYCHFPFYTMWIIT